MASRKEIKGQSKIISPERNSRDKIISEEKKFICECGEKDCLKKYLNNSQIVKKKLPTENFRIFEEKGKYKIKLIKKKSNEKVAYVDFDLEETLGNVVSFPIHSAPALNEYYFVFEQKDNSHIVLFEWFV